MSHPEFAAALGRIPSGIFVITAKKGQEESALLGSWVQQVSFEPPTVSVAVHKDRPIDAMLAELSPFVINILQKDDIDIYKHFVKGFKPGENPFEGIQTEPSQSGPRIVLDALATLECRVRTRVDVGDHTLVVADVLGGKMLQDDAEPRVHIRKNGLSY